MKLSRGAALVVMMFLAYAESVEAQERRVVAVNVLDEQGRQVTGLTAENFRGKYRGQPVKILSATWDSQPRRIVIVVDQSNSMFWAKKWEVARNAVEVMAALGSERNQTAMVLFSTQAIEVTGFQEGPGAIAQRWEDMERNKKALEKAFSRTPLFDGIVSGLELLKPTKAGDALFVVSDGGADNASRTPVKDVRQAVFCSEARVYFLYLLDPDRVGRGTEGYGQHLGQELAEGSGGAVLIPRGHPAQYLGKKQQEEMASALRWLYEQIQSFYVVEVELPAPVDKTRDWTLEVVDAAGKKRKDARVVYPRRVAACGGRKP